MKNCIPKLNLLSAVCFIFFCLFTSFLPKTAENPFGWMFPRGGDEDWGRGAYFMPQHFKIPVYKNETGELLGHFSRGKHLYPDLIRVNGKRVNYRANGSDVEWIFSDQLILLKTKFIPKSDYIKVFWKSIEGGAFIKKMDMQNTGIRYFSYEDYLFGKDLPSALDEITNGSSIGVNIEKSCLYLRKAPSYHAEKLDCVPGNDWNNHELSHMEILDYSYPWAKVEVTAIYYKIGASDGGDDDVSYIKSKKVGWLKAIDRSGFPNIWFPVSGY